MSGDEFASPHFEDLAKLEKEYAEAEEKTLRYQEVLVAPLHQKRKELSAKIPYFWALVLEQAPPEIEEFIGLDDTIIFNTCLSSLDVSRFEIAPSDTGEAATKGHSRSVKIRFEFKQKDNKWFEDEFLEKTFWYRKSKDGFAGLVSEPIKIHWKEGQDITHGLTNAVYNAWEAEKKAGQHVNGKKLEKLPEHERLLEKIQSRAPGAVSFFAWFSFIGRRVSAEESAAVTEDDDEGQMSDEEDMEESFTLEEEMEVFPGGEDLAVALAEDLWPNAIQYFTAAHDGPSSGSGSDDDSDEAPELYGDDGNSDDDSDDGDEPAAKRMKA